MTEPNREDATGPLMSMSGELTHLDRTVIEALSARYARGGEAAFDEAVSRLVIAVCAVLAHTRCTARLRENAIGGKRLGKLLH